MCVNSWRNNWAELATYFKYPEGIRKLIYTTNRIENFNRQLRKVTKKQNNISKRLRTTKKLVSSDGRCFK